MTGQNTKNTRKKKKRKKTPRNLNPINPRNLNPINPRKELEKLVQKNKEARKNPTRTYGTAFIRIIIKRLKKHLTKAPI